MKRSYALVWLRIVACIFVIGIHAVSILSSGNGFVYLITNHIVRMGLAIFFFLSSISLVSKKDLLANLGGYYRGKFFKLGVPFLIWSIIYYEINHNTSGTLINILTNIPGALLSIRTNPANYHLLFMYTLLGLVLLNPFLKRMIDHLDQKSLGILCLIVMLEQLLVSFNIILIGETYFVPGCCIIL